jgi:hypothetical protein
MDRSIHRQVDVPGGSNAYHTVATNDELEGL